MVDYIRDEHKCKISRACKIVDLSRSMYYYTSIKNDTEVLTKVMELAEKRPHEGQHKIYHRLRNEGYKWNRKKISRIYRKLGMNKKKRIRKRLQTREKSPLFVPHKINDTLSMDFMHDTLMNGRKFRVLNLIDDYNREALAIEPYLSISSLRVITILNRLILERGTPRGIRVDNGPEFLAQAMQDWCATKGITLQYIQPGKPNQNAYIERFNRSFREAVLDANLFEDLIQVRIAIDEFKDDYNYYRPHDSIGNISPVNYKIKHAGCEFF